MFKAVTPITTEAFLIEWGNHSMRLEENHNRTTTVTILIDKGDAGKCAATCVVPTSASTICNSWEEASGWSRSLEEEPEEGEFFAIAHLRIIGLGYLVMIVNHDHGHPQDTIAFHATHHGA